MTGQVFMYSGGAPGSQQDVVQLRNTDIGRRPWAYFRTEALDGVTDMVISDGGFISVTPTFDHHNCSPPQNFEPGSDEAAQYAVHTHFRSTVEHVPGAIKNLFHVVDQPSKLGEYLACDGKFGMRKPMCDISLNTILLRQSSPHPFGTSGYKGQPRVHQAAVFLYNFLKQREGLLAENRYDWM